MFIECGGLASDPDGPALGKRERGSQREAKDKKTNGSNPLKLMTVCLSE